MIQPFVDHLDTLIESLRTVSVVLRPAPNRGVDPLD
jgi:hypothetical protein